MIDVRVGGTNPETVAPVPQIVVHLFSLLILAGVPEKDLILTPWLHFLFITSSGENVILKKGGKLLKYAKWYLRGRFYSPSSKILLFGLSDDIWANIW